MARTIASSTEYRVAKSAPQMAVVAKAPLSEADGIWPLLTHTPYLRHVNTLVTLTDVGGVSVQIRSRNPSAAARRVSGARRRATWPAVLARAAS